MARKRTRQLLFPIKGEHRAAAYQRQPPYTTPSSLNVRPLDAMEDRGRGGTRPGFGRYISTQLGSGNPIRMLMDVRPVALSSTTVLDVDAFAYSGTLHSQAPADWAAGTWSGCTGSPTADGTYAKPTAITNYYGAVYTPTSTPDNTCPMRVRVVMGTMTDATCELLAMLPNGTSLATGVRYSAVHSSGAFYSYLYVNGTEVDTWSSGVHMPSSQILELEVLPNGVVNAYHHGYSGVTPIMTYDASGDKGSWGLVSGMIVRAVSAVAQCQVDTYQFEYTSTPSDFPCGALVAVANGNIYGERPAGAINVQDSGPTCCTSKQLMGCDWLGTAYIADYEGDGVDGGAGDGVYTNATKTFTSASINFAAVGITAGNAVGWCLEITGQASPAITGGKYTVASYASPGDPPVPTITLSEAIADGDRSSVTFALHRWPKKYVITNGTHGVSANWTGGTTAANRDIPLGCKLLVPWHSCAVMAGCKDVPTAVYLSEMDDWDEWTPVGSAVGSAVVLAAGDSDTGGIGSPVTALAPVARDVLVIGCAGELWRLLGHPTMGGRLDNVSRVVGIKTGTSWCLTPDGTLVFLSDDGVYALPYGASTQVVPLSRAYLPTELTRINISTHAITMQYEAASFGVHIYVSPYTTGDASHWFLHWPTQSFWSASIPGTQDVFSACSKSATDATSAVSVFGCRDGYLRYYSSAFTDDDGTAITSHVTLGPMKLGPVGRRGMLNELQATLDDDSGSITWTLYTGDTAEATLSAAAACTGTFTAGLNYSVKPNRSGIAYLLKLSNAGTTPWAFESIDETTTPLGPTMKLA